MKEFRKWLNECMEANMHDDSRVKNGAFNAFLAVNQYLDNHELVLEEKEDD